MRYCPQCGKELRHVREECPLCMITASPNAPIHPTPSDPATELDLFGGANLLDSFAWNSQRSANPFPAPDNTQEPPRQPTTENEVVFALMPAQGILHALNDPALRARFLKAAALSLIKSLGLSAVVLIPGLILLAISPLAGVTWMFFGSFFLMARTYQKPWRLMWITCLTPAVASGLCFMIQLAIFHDRIPPIVVLLPCASFGALVGIVRARSHSLYVENGSVMAQRTVGYLVIWAVCYGLTQLLGLFAGTMPLVSGSLLASALSTSMLICVSLVILSRYSKMKRTSHSAGSHPNVVDAVVIGSGDGQ